MYIWIVLNNYRFTLNNGEEWLLNILSVCINYCIYFSKFSDDTYKTISSFVKYTNEPNNI